MDTAYDALQPSPAPSAPQNEQPTDPSTNDIVISAELAQAYNKFSTSSWGQGFSSFLGTVRKQGEGLYEGVSKEVGELRREVGVEISRARGASLTTSQAPTVAAQEKSRAEATDSSSTLPAATAIPPLDSETPPAQGEKAAPQTNFLDRFRTEAAQRLQTLQRAEDAADEALARLGSNLASFLKESVTISPSSATTDPSTKSSLLFETRAPSDLGPRRALHATRLDGQIHLLHMNPRVFSQDPISTLPPSGEKPVAAVSSGDVVAQRGTIRDEWASWCKPPAEGGFDVAGEAETARITGDLERYPELRRMFERLAGPDGGALSEAESGGEGVGKVEYGDFWRRYYFVRGVVEKEDERRREMIKAAAQSKATESGVGADEEVGWGNDSDDEDRPSTATQLSHKPSNIPANKAPADAAPTGSEYLRPDSATTEEQRERANSVISDGSYDIVSQATSTARASPKTAAMEVAGAGGKKEDESDEDWE